MFALLSPAKTLDYATPLPNFAGATRPRFAADAATLARSAANLSQKRLGELMGVSPALARLNAGRFRDFGEAPERPAVYAFAGDVYTGLDAGTLDEAQLRFAQDHLRLLSGLYGLLRPLDAIRPHRLEMGTRWAPRKPRLTDWWGDRIAASLREELDGRPVLNLASQEYWAAIDGRLPGARVVSVDFRDGGRFVSFHAKRARGMMARWVVEHHVSAIDAARGFDAGGYRFDAAASEPDRWTFAR